MFGTQKLAPMLRRAKDAFVFERSACFDEDDEDDEGEEGEEGRQRDPQRDVRILAEMLEIDISLIFVSDQVCMRKMYLQILDLGYSMYIKVNR